MPFRPPPRRPEGLRTVSVVFALLLSIFLGGEAGKGASSPRSPWSGDPGPNPAAEADSAAYWIFLEESAWERFETDRSSFAMPGRVRVVSRWLRAVSVWTPAEAIDELASLPDVVSVRPVRSLRRPPPWGGAKHHQSGVLSHPQRPSDASSGVLEAPLSILEIPQAHALGFLGTGTRVGILDGFFWSQHTSLQNHPPLAVRDFVDEDGSVAPGMGDPPEAATHGTAIWSLVSGQWPDTLVGVAPDAGVLLARVVSSEDGAGADEDRWVAGLEWLESQGARVVLSAVGFRNFEDGGYTAADLNGDVAPTTLAADQAARRGVLVVAPVGNLGPEPASLQTPSDGDSVMAVGATTLQGVESIFSAQGPTADGRPKPELLAPGQGYQAASGVGTRALEGVEGTEFAAALLAAAAALYVEAYPERGPMAVLESFARSASSRNAFPARRLPAVAPAILFPDGIHLQSVQGVDGQGQATTLRPLFQWNVPTIHPLGLPITFHLELSEDSLFPGTLVSDSVVGTFARRIQTPLPPRTSLYWRVRAESVQGVTWSTEPAGPIHVPSWVRLDVLNGPGGTQITDPQPEFRWTPMELPPPAGPFMYQLQVLLDRENEVVADHSNLEGTRFRVEEPLPFNVPLRWRVIAETRSGMVDTVASVAPFVVTGGASPPVTILYQNFPNPFPGPEEGMAETRIWFDLARESEVRLAVYDLRGRLVRNLIPSRGCGPVRLSPGLYGRDGGPSDPCAAYSWDGRDNGGSRVSPGVYLLRLQAGGVVDVRRMVFWP